MKRQHHISFSVSSEHGPRLLELLTQLDLVKGWRPIDDLRVRPGFGGTIDSTDSRLGQLRSVLHEFGPDVLFLERIDEVYTDSELRSFPLLHLIVERKEIGPFGPSHGTTYDLSTGCPQCGCGAVQTSPFYAPAKSFPKTGLIVQSSTETFVAEHLADALRDGQVTGLELRRACSHRDHQPLPWWQVIAQHTMPRMSAATRGIVQKKGELHGNIRDGPAPCASCRRDGHYNTVKEPEGIAYAASEVSADALPDVVQTWECFAVSRIDPTDFRRSRFAEPAILVKPRAFDIVRALKVKHAAFVPVRIA